MLCSSTQARRPGIPLRLLLTHLQVSSQIKAPHAHCTDSTKQSASRSHKNHSQKHGSATGWGHCRLQVIATGQLPVPTGQQLNAAWIHGLGVISSPLRGAARDGGKCRVVQSLRVTALTKYKFVRSTIGVTCYTHQLEAPLGDGGKGRVVQTFECIQLCHAQLLEAGALQSGGDYRSSNGPVAGRQLKLPATLPWQVLCDAQRYGGWVAALAQAHGCRLPMAFQNAALAHAHGCGLPMAFQNVRKMSAPDAGGQGEYKYNLSTKPIEVTSF